MLARHEPGYDGTELFLRERPIHGTRQKQRNVVRCAPGSFERRYGVGEYDPMREALYQAGVKFGQIIERAGMDGPGTVDWAKVGHSQWKGPSSGRLIAMEEWKRLNDPKIGLGKLRTTRLIQFVVQGLTSAQMARKYRVSKRMMASELNGDLAMAAILFGYAPGAKNAPLTRGTIHVWARYT